MKVFYIFLIFAVFFALAYFFPKNFKILGIRADIFFGKKKIKDEEDE